MNESSWRHPGWRVVFTCFFLAVFAWGFGFYGHGVFLAELQKQHGWSSGLIAGATTVYYLMGGVLVAFVGDAIALLGPRRFLLLGLLALGLSAAAIPFVTSAWQLYAAYALMAVGWAGTSLAAIVNILGQWFTARRGMAISLALNGASSGSIIVAPAMVALSAWLGFSWAVPLTVLAMAIIMVPMVLLWVDRPPAGLTSASACAPGNIAPGPAWSKAKALGSLAFWSVALPFALAIAAQAGFLVHQISVLQVSIGSINASVAVAVTGACAIAGRVALSLFVDRLDQRAAAALLLLMQAAALFAISRTVDLRSIYIACGIFGLGVGNLITLPALVVQREFPPAAFATVTSLSTSVMGLTYAFAPGILGILRDLTGSYHLPLQACMATEILAAMLILPRLAPRPGP